MSDTPRTDAERKIELALNLAEEKVCQLHERVGQLEIELADARLVLSLTRTILAGEDAGSLPSDFPVDGMAGERMKDLLNTRRELTEKQEVLNDTLRQRNELQRKLAYYERATPQPSAKQDTSTPVSHTDEKRIPSPCDPNNPLHQVAAELIASKEALK